MATGASMRNQRVTKWSFVSASVVIGLCLAGCSSPAGTADSSSGRSTTTTATPGSSSTTTTSSKKSDGPTTKNPTPSSHKPSSTSSTQTPASSSTTSSTHPSGKGSKPTTAAEVAANTPPCSAATLTAQGGRTRIASSGAALGTVVLTNSSDGSCFLSGDPTVALIGSSGAPLGVELIKSANHALPAVLLVPHAAADLIVTWTNWCGSVPGPLQIRVAIIGSPTALVAPFDGPPGSDYVPSCTSARKATTLTVVYAYQKGALAKSLSP